MTPEGRCTPAIVEKIIGLGIDRSRWLARNSVDFDLYGPTAVRNYGTKSSMGVGYTGRKSTIRSLYLYIYIYI